MRDAPGTGLVAEHAKRGRPTPETAAERLLLTPPVPTMEVALSCGLNSMTIESDASATEGLIPRLTPRHRVAFLTTGAAATAVAILMGMEPLVFPTWEHRIVSALVLLGFMLAEQFAYNIEVKHESIGHSPSEIPMAIGLLLLDPYALVITRLIGAGFGMLVADRSMSFKFRFNLAHMAAEAAVACALFAAAPAVLGDSILGSWLALMSSLTIATSLGGLFVTAAIAQFDGDVLGRLRRELRVGPLVHVPAVAFAASVAIPIGNDPELGLIAAVPGPVIWLVVRSNSSLDIASTTWRASTVSAAC